MKSIASKIYNLFPFFSECLTNTAALHKTNLRLGNYATGVGNTGSFLESGCILVCHLLMPSFSHMKLCEQKTSDHMAAQISSTWLI